MSKILCVSKEYADLLKPALEVRGHEVIIMHTFIDAYRTLLANPDIQLAIWDPEYLDPEKGPQLITSFEWISRVKDSTSHPVIHVGFFYSGYTEAIIKMAKCDHIFPLIEIVAGVCDLLK